MTKTVGMIIALIITFTLAGAFVLGYYARPLIEETAKETSSKQFEITEASECSELELQETARCLRDFVSTFYNYTVRSDEERTLEEIKENGGDCYDYNSLYERLAKELGFEGYSFRIETKDLAHRFAIIMDDTGYCRLDQLIEPDCFMFSKKGDEE